MTPIIIMFAALRRMEETEMTEMIFYNINSDFYCFVSKFSNFKNLSRAVQINIPTVDFTVGVMALSSIFV